MQVLISSCPYRDPTGTMSMPGVLGCSDYRQKLTRQKFMTVWGSDLVRTKLEFHRAVQLLRIPALRKKK